MICPKCKGSHIHREAFHGDLGNGNVWSCHDCHYQDFKSYFEGKTTVMVGVIPGCVSGSHKFYVQKHIDKNYLHLTCLSCRLELEINYVGYEEVRDFQESPLKTEDSSEKTYQGSRCPVCHSERFTDGKKVGIPAFFRVCERCGVVGAKFGD